MFNKFKNYIDITNTRLNNLSKKEQISSKFDSKIEMDEIIISKINGLLGKFKKDGL